MSKIGNYTILTTRPASLLCKFMVFLIFLPFSCVNISGASTKDLLNHSPQSMLSLQPPHFQPSTECSPYLDMSHEHSVKFPTLQDFVVACTTPALKMAQMNAVSRLPGNGNKCHVIILNKKSYKFFKKSYTVRIQLKSMTEMQKNILCSLISPKINKYAKHKNKKKLRSLKYIQQQKTMHLFVKVYIGVNHNQLHIADRLVGMHTNTDILGLSDDLLKEILGGNVTCRSIDPLLLSSDLLETISMLQRKKTKTTED